MEKEKYIGNVSGHALVLGGGGIGSEIIRALFANGVSKVSFTFSGNKERAEKLEAELTREGHDVRAFLLKDIRSSEEVDAVLESSILWAGEEVVAMVNTVGISPNTPLEEQTPEEWQKVIEVNMAGNFFAVRTVAKRMRARGIRGSIISISSDNSTVSWSPISAHYDSSKAGMNLSVKELAYHFAKNGIRINTVLPGWTKTPLNDSLPDDERKDVLSRIWLGRMAEPAEIAKVVVFVLGSGGSFMTGAEITINGGYR